jgi:predicted  nucleic acid-binding Zn-ribbon protein
VSAALSDLLAVQDLDLTADRLRHRRENLPERAEIQSVSNAARGLENELAAVSTVLAPIAKEQSDAEAELASSESRAKAVERRLYGGEVSASRELQAMASDLEGLKKRASALEDRILELLDTREPLDATVASITADLEHLAARRSELEAGVKVVEGDLDREIASVAGPRADAAARVPPALMASYERLRGRLGGIGVARLVGDRCDGCHLTLSAAELDAIRHLPEGEVATCDQCTRILVPA